MLCVVVTVTPGSATSRATTSSALHLSVVGMATPTACKRTLIVTLSICAVLLKMKSLIMKNVVMFEDQVYYWVHTHFALQLKKPCFFGLVFVFFYLFQICIQVNDGIRTVFMNNI